MNQQEKRFECPRCSYWTIHAHLFLNHLSTKHPDEAEEILCDLITQRKIRIEVARKMSELELLKTELARLEKERDVLRLTKQCYQAVIRLHRVFALDLKTGRMLAFEILVEKPRPKK